MLARALVAKDAEHVVDELLAVGRLFADAPAAGRRGGRHRPAAAMEESATAIRCAGGVVL
jgi:hypothetical protein